MNDLEKNEYYEHIQHAQMNHIHFFISNILYCPPHFHHDIEMIQVIEGQVTFSTANESCSLQAGEIALFNANEVHSIRGDHDTNIILVVQIDPNFCIQHYPPIKYIRFKTANITSAVPFTICLEMIQVFYNLGYNYYSQIKAFELRCMSDLFKLFWYIVTYVPYTTLSDAEMLARKNQQQRICSIIEYMRCHYTEKLTLSQIAEKENLSLTYLSHLFTETMNMSFQHYLNLLRLEKALFLLNNTEMNMLEVCINSGFSDYKYLNKQFMQKFGISPKEYRKQAKSLADPADILYKGLKKQTIYSSAEGLKILRKHNHFNCDLNLP